MPVSIIANASAQVTQAAMRARNDALITGANRLSSGLRVATAGDDAAALAVGTSLRITNSGLSTAILNASSAVSTLQIADGALDEVSNVLIRMQALATQASSGQLDNATRALVDIEFQNLKTEVERIAQITEFNGVKLLAGSRAFAITTGSGLAAQGIPEVRLDPQLINADRSFRISYDSSTESMTVQRLDAATTATQTIDLTALLDAVGGVGQNLSSGARLDVGFSALGLTVSLDSLFDRGGNITAANTLAAGPDITIATPVYTPVSINAPQDIAAALNALVSNYTASSGNLQLPLTSNGVNVRLGAVTGLSYSVNGAPATASGVQSDALVGAGPNTIEIYADLQAPATGTTLVGAWATGAVGTTGTTAGSLTLGVGTGLVGADYTNNNAATRLTYKIGTGVTSGQDLLNVDIPAFNLDALGLTTIDVRSEPNANASITALKAALTTLNQGRATVGAQQLRLEQISSNLGVVTTNNEAARSALLDADITKEISDYTANQALLEAGVSMLSRANQLPNLLLQLLRNG